MCVFYEGTAGYGNTTFTIDQSYADQPNLAPILFNPSAPAGQRWTRDGLSSSTIPRMYHSTATLLPDGKFYPAGVCLFLGLRNSCSLFVQALFWSLDLIRTLISTTRRPTQRNIVWKYSIRFITTSEGRNRRDFQTHLLMEELISTYHCRRTICSTMSRMPRTHPWLSFALGSRRMLW